ncbi:hypothetical protein NM208_g16263 [Fusarium decemcellulare]|uniref:Uncharacterized protein n=1 Tax=Fusarium decemcellulare TaxID=57161 RepID=A0ACC1RAQ2_9HYPO|nr:hypothetical protein NM208_g16263 [Fusarium decemcellulare]
MGTGQYPQTGHAQQQMYGNNAIYSPGGSHGNMPSAYGQQAGQYGQMVMSQPPQQMAQGQYAQMPQPNMYQQGGMRPVRQRASTMEQQQSGIPAAIQRVASHLDPSQLSVYNPARLTIRHLATAWEQGVPTLLVQEQVEEEAVCSRRPE